MKSQEIVPFKCSICGNEIGSPIFPTFGKSLICGMCNQIVCLKCSIKKGNLTYCRNCKS